MQFCLVVILTPCLMMAYYCICRVQAHISNTWPVHTALTADD